MGTIPKVFSEPFPYTFKWWLKAKYSKAFTFGSFPQILLPLFFLIYMWKK